MRVKAHQHLPSPPNEYSRRIYDAALAVANALEPLIKNKIPFTAKHVNNAFEESYPFSSGTTYQYMKAFLERYWYYSEQVKNFPKT